MTEAERIWQSKSDEDLIEAAGELESYTEDGQRIIRAELRRRGLEDPLEQARFTAAALGISPPEPAAAPEIAVPGPNCLRCEVKLRFVGAKEFFEKGSTIDVFVCPLCGHVDFFVSPDGAGGLEQ